MGLMACQRCFEARCHVSESPNKAWMGRFGIVSVLIQAPSYKLELLALGCCQWLDHAQVGHCNSAFQAPWWYSLTVLSINVAGVDGSVCGDTGVSGACGTTSCLCLICLYTWWLGCFCMGRRGVLSAGLMALRIPASRCCWLVCSLCCPKPGAVDGMLTETARTQPLLQ